MLELRTFLHLESMANNFQSTPSKVLSLNQQKQFFLLAITRTSFKYETPQLLITEWQVCLLLAGGVLDWIMIMNLVLAGLRSASITEIF